MKSRKSITVNIEKVLKLTLICLLVLSLVSCETGAKSEQEESDQQFEKDDGVKTYNELVETYS